MNFLDKILGIFTGRRPDDAGAPGSAASPERQRRYEALKQQLASQLSQPRGAWRPALADMAARADLVVVNQAVAPAALADWLAFVGPTVPADAQGWFAVLELRARGPQAAAMQATAAQAAAATAATAQAAAQGSSAQSGPPGQSSAESPRALPATSGLGNYVRGW